LNLHRFWFKFTSNEPYDYLQLGCGVTAKNYDDALSLLRETVFFGEEIPEIGAVVEDIDLSGLDQKHVIPNMEPPNCRGVWFPRGFSRLIDL